MLSSFLHLRFSLFQCCLPLCNRFCFLRWGRIFIPIFAPRPWFSPRHFRCRHNQHGYSCGNDRIGTHDSRHTLPLPLPLPLLLALVCYSHIAVGLDSLSIRKAIVRFLVHHPTPLHSGFLVRYSKQLQSICITSARQQRSDICRKEKSRFNRIVYHARTEASYSACFVPTPLCFSD